MSDGYKELYLMAQNEKVEYKNQLTTAKSHIEILTVNMNFETNRANQAEASNSALTNEREEAMELLYEIREDTVNPQDEADKYLRDHKLSKLSTALDTIDKLKGCCVEVVKLSEEIAHQCDFHCINGKEWYKAVQKLSALLQPDEERKEK